MDDVDVDDALTPDNNGNTDDGVFNPDTGLLAKSAPQQKPDYDNECIGVDCGIVDDVNADYQPNRDAPEFGCNGGDCGSPEAEQALEIELTAQGPCQGEACNMDLVAKLSNEPNRQPNAQLPTEDCAGAEGCGNVEDAVIKNSGIEIGCVGSGCVVVSVKCDVASGMLCDPDQVMQTDNQQVTDEPTTAQTDPPTQPPTQPTTQPTTVPQTQPPTGTDGLLAKAITFGATTTG